MQEQAKGSLELVPPSPQFVRTMEVIHGRGAYESLDMDGEVFGDFDGYFSRVHSQTGKHFRYVGPLLHPDLSCAFPESLFNHVVLTHWSDSTVTKSYDSDGPVTASLLAGVPFP